MKRFLLFAFVGFTAVCFSATAYAQQPIAIGIDLLETNSEDTFEDLSDLDLLCPGCFVIGDPLIQLEGVPLGMSPACPGFDLGSTDTIIRSKQRRPFFQTILQLPFR